MKTWKWLILGMAIILSSLSAQDKKPVKAAADTTVSRTDLIGLLEKQQKGMQDQFNMQLAEIQGKINALKMQTSDSVKVAKSVFR